MPWAATPAYQRALAFGVRRNVVEVHVHDSEAVRITLGPLEVVEEGPHEEAAQIDTRVERGTRRPQVRVEIGDPIVVVDRTVRTGFVVERAPALVHEQRRRVVLLV